ncbi:hypothetical protein HC762_01075 [bacterium]|nr:hypothetical protein [bacterium]
MIAKISENPRISRTSQERDIYTYQYRYQHQNETLSQTLIHNEFPDRFFFFFASYFLFFFFSKFLLPQGWEAGFPPFAKKEGEQNEEKKLAAFTWNCGLNGNTREEGLIFPFILLFDTNALGLWALGSGSGLWALGILVEAIPGLVLFRFSLFFTYHHDFVSRPPFPAPNCRKMSPTCAMLMFLLA